MNELRSYIRSGDTLYYISTGNLFRGAYETVVFALRNNNRNLTREVHREVYDNKKNAVESHKEIFDSLAKEKNDEFMAVHSTHR